MEHDDFLANLLKNADSLLHSTIKESLNNNPAYKKLVQKEDMAESAFIEISSSLTKEQRDIIDCWLEKRDLLNDEYSTMAYVQGYIDCIRLLKVLHINIPED